MTTVTVTHAVCPHCGERASTVDHCTKDWFPPWSCDHCGGWYEVRRAPPGGTGSAFQVRKALENGADKPIWPLHWVLLRRDDVRLLLKKRRCASWGESTDEYYFNEGTCPTNYLRDVVQISAGKEIDPHGVFEFIRTWPVRPTDDEEEILREIAEREP